VEAMTTILEKLDQLHGTLEYRDYCELHDMASELLAKVARVAQYQAHLLEASVRAPVGEERIAETMVVISGELALCLRDDP